MPRLKKDVSPLLERSIASLTLAIEIFNRPSEVGRVHSVLMLLHHSFELLLKAALLQRRIAIFEGTSRFTFGFDKCLDLAETQLQVLTSDERSTLSILDAQRDQAQHYWSDISEDVLYVHAQSSVTLFDRVVQKTFGIALVSRIPTRVLPISTRPPTDLSLLFEQELSAVDTLLAKGTRKTAKAAARLRAILAFAVGARSGPERVSQKELDAVVKRRRKGAEWSVILPEIAQLRLATEGGGLPITMKISKNAPVSVSIAKDGEPAVGTLVKLEVNIWDKYNLGLADLAGKLGTSTMRTLALVRELGLQADKDCFHLLTKGKSTFKGYSKPALDRLRAAVAEGRTEEAWAKQDPHLSGKKKGGGA